MALVLWEKWNVEILRAAVVWGAAQGCRAHLSTHLGALVHVRSRVCLVQAQLRDNVSASRGWDTAAITPRMLSTGASVEDPWPAFADAVLPHVRVHVQPADVPQLAEAWARRRRVSAGPRDDHAAAAPLHLLFSEATDGVVDDLCRALPQLARLSLHRSNITDAALGQLSCALPQLGHLWLEHCDAITDAGVAQLLCQRPRLVTQITNCKLVRRMAALL